MAARLCSGCDTIITSGRLCQRCRYKQTRRSTPAPVLPAGATVTLVYGPPCAGKNTHVTQHASPGDLVVDFDAIITALGGTGGHDQPEQLRPFAFDCVDAVMRRLASGDHIAERAWVIQTAPTRAQRAPFRRGELVGLIPDKAVCVERARRERPKEWLGYIDNWYARYEPEG